MIGEVSEPGRGAGAAGRSGDALAALTAGAVASAWACALVGVVAGALVPAAGVAAIAVGLAAGVAVYRAGPEPGPGSRAAHRITRGEVLALTAFAAVSIRQFGWLAFARGGERLTLLPYNYGDLPLHWTYVAHFARGARFWPENPVFTGERLRYPLGVDLLSAIPFQLGLPMPLVLVATGLAGAALTALALRRWGGAFAVAGFLFAGGLAGFELLWTGSLHDYQSAVAWKSLYLALFVPQRGFLLAMPAGLLLLWSFRQRLLRGGPGLAPWVEGLLWGTLPLVHLHTFLFVSVMAAAWAFGGGRWRSALPAFALALPLATWAVVQVTDRFRATSLLGWKPGWMIGGEGPLVFLLLNFGLFLPLALVALVRAARRRDREALLVLCPALGVLAALFLVRLAPWEWDNTKVMLWCYVAALPIVASHAVFPLRPLARAVVLAGLFFSGAVSVVAASVGEGGDLLVLDEEEHRAVCGAVAAVSPDERVATAQTHNHPAALCGQPLVAGYSGHLWSHGLDSKPVEQSLARLMRGEGDWRAEARRLGARYLFWGPREAAAFATSTRPWESAGPPVASGPWGALYRID
jgi:hypothetical protein